MVSFSVGSLSRSQTNVDSSFREVGVISFEGSGFDFLRDESFNLGLQLYSSDSCFETSISKERFRGQNLI